MGAPQFFAQVYAWKEQDRRSFFRWKRVSLCKETFTRAMEGLWETLLSERHCRWTGL